MRRSDENFYEIDKDSFDKLMNDVSEVKKQVNKSDINELKYKIDELSSDHNRLSQEQSSLKEEISSIKDSLLEPTNGLIVKVNKNTEYRKKTSKALWILFVSIIGLIIDSIKNIIP